MDSMVSVSPSFASTIEGIRSYREHGPCSFFSTTHSLVREGRGVVFMYSSRATRIFFFVVFINLIIARQQYCNWISFDREHSLDLYGGVGEIIGNSFFNIPVGIQWRYWPLFFSLLVEKRTPSDLEWKLQVGELTFERKDFTIIMLSISYITISIS